MYYASRMMTVEQIYDEVGRDVLMQRLGVSKSAMTNAIAAGKFPAGWFRIIRIACEEVGVGCPEHLFNFKAVKSKAVPLEGEAIPAEKGAA